MIRARFASSVAVLAAIAGGAASATAAQQATTPVDSQMTRAMPIERCNDPVRNAAASRELIEAIRAAVAALPADRQTAEDYEAAMVFAIGQRELCPGVARDALAALGSGSTGTLRQAALRVSNSLLPGATGTAGLRASGDNLGSGSFFSPPVVGIGGGSANYSQ